MSENTSNERIKRPTGPVGHGGRPGMAPGEKAANFGPSMRRLLGHLRPERALIGVVVVMAAMGVALNVIGPKILARATDLIFGGILGHMLGDQLRAKLPAGAPMPTTDQVVQMLQSSPDEGMHRLADMVRKLGVVPGVGIDYGRLGTIMLIALGCYLLAAILLWGQGWLLNGAVQRSIYRMRAEVSHKLNRLPLSYFDSQPRGELLSRVTNDIDNVAQSLQQTLSQMLNALLMVLGVGIMMFTTSWQLALIALTMIPLIMVGAGFIMKASQKRFAAVWASTGKLNASVEEGFTGHALVKVFGRQREVQAAFEEHNESLRAANMGAQFLSSLMMPVAFFIGNLNYVVVAVYGGLRVAHGQMTLGDVQAFMQYSRMFTQPLTQLASMTNLLQSGVASAERVFEVLDATEQTLEDGAPLPTPLQGRVAFEDVSFSYTDEPLIQDLDLRAEPGQTVAIVGPTGAGKTTLVNLLMRFYEVGAGRITLDGVDIASVPRAELRSQMGMVLQDTWLFNGTIRDNIAYGRLDASEDDILAAAQATYVDRFAHSLPEGYDTVIDEEASNVSAGEKQLITIARAFLSDPSILILDEATSSVDTRTEVLVQKAMTALRHGRTSFVIAHRLSTIRDADLVLVMEKGRIVEQGSHAELLERKGAFWRLHQAQFVGTEDAA